MDLRTHLKFLAAALILTLLPVPPSGAAEGDITTIAGDGTSGFGGDGAAATAAQLSSPDRIAVDASGNIIFSDTSNNRIRKIDAATGIISTVAGGGGSFGDGGPATDAQLVAPQGVDVDAAGNIFIADYANQVIRRVDATTGIISTVAGDNFAGGGYSGDGAAATAAQLNLPTDIAVDAAGNLFIADAFNHRIRRVDATTGIISTVAGDGTAAFGGDGAAATAAQLDTPLGVAVDAAGNLLIADNGNDRIRRVDATTGFISTVAGDGTNGFGGDGAAATAAQLAGPFDIAVDAAGNLLIADTFNGRIRKVNASGIISTVAGDGTPAFGGDGAAATAAQLFFPRGVAVDAAGNILIADQGNNRIRSVEGPTIPQPASIPSDTWTTWYNLASYYYYFYAVLGDYNTAAALYYYYYCIGDFYFYAAYGNLALADFSYYNGLALYYLYAYDSTPLYYYHLALAYYYYFVGVGDFSSANLYYNAYISAAFGG